MTAIVLDCETTGLIPHEDRIIELAIVDYETGDLIFHSFFNPGRALPEFIVNLTKITDEMLMYAPPFDREIGEAIAAVISNSEAIIGQNPLFDKMMLAAEFQRCGVSVKWPPTICTKRIWNKYEPPEERHLINAYKRFVDRIGFEGAHGAVADTKAAREVFLAQVVLFDLGNLGWEEFFPEEKKWWGGTSHIIWGENGGLVCNFGKHKGIPCFEIEAGYWRWIKNESFPAHVVMLANYMVNISPTTQEELITWAKENQ